MLLFQIEFETYSNAPKQKRRKNYASLYEYMSAIFNDTQKLNEFKFAARQRRIVNYNNDIDALIMFFDNLIVPRIEIYTKALIFSNSM